MKPIAVVAALSTAFALDVVGCFGHSTPHESPDGGTFPGFDSGVPADDDASGPAAATLPTATIDFGLVDCGTQAAAKTYSFKNTGPVAVVWSAAADSVFVIQGPASGTVPPGASGSLTVATTDIPTTQDPGVAVAGTLTLTTNVPGYTTVKVPLSVTPQGGSLVLSPSVVGFGAAIIGTPENLAFTLQNVGNAPVGVTLGAPSDAEFSLTYTGAPSPATIGPGASLAGASATFSPASTGAKSATAAIQVTGALCASAASSVPLSGTGANYVSVGPSPLDFGTVSCGKSAAAQAITIKSTYGSTIHYTATLGQGAASPYTLDAPTGSVVTDGQAVINVTPLPIPVPGDITPGFYDDQLTVGTDIPGQAPIVIPLQESASGAVLALTMTSSAFGTVSNTTATLPFTVTNTGNAAASVSVAVTGTGYSGALTGNDTATANGGTVDGTVSFTAKTNGSAAGTVTASSASDPVCNVPSPVDLTATGAVPVATYPSGTVLSLGATCGGAVTQATLVVQNTGNAPLTISNAASKQGLFTATVSPATAAPGGTATITAIAAAAPSGAIGGTAAGDTLTFSTNEPGAPSYSVPVSVVYHGANLAFSGGNLVTVSTCGNVGYTVVNTGDMAASVYVSGPYTSDGAFLFGGGFATSAPGTSVAASGGTAADSVARNFQTVGCQGSCIYGGSESFVSLGSTGTSAGICVALPTLSLSLDLPSCDSCC